MLNPPADRNLTIGSNGTTVALSGIFGLSGVRGPIAEISTSQGSMFLELFPEVTPQTVANFRKYTTAASYDQTFIHRSVKDFVIQGGGYKIASPFTHIPTFGNVRNEFQRSNEKGTIAMAKLAGDIDSATSEWYINLVDNPFLDGPGQRFTVFGRLLGNSIGVAEKIAALPIGNAGGALGSLPLQNYSGGDIYTSNLVGVPKIREISLLAAGNSTASYLKATASSSNSSIVGIQFPSAGSLRLVPGSTAGVAQVSLRATDPFGRTASTNFRVHNSPANLPLVSIAAVDSIASETAGDSAKFRISRTGATASSLTVPLSFSGSTAAAGVDFQPSPAAITIPSGKSSADLTIRSVDDGLLEGNERIVVEALTAANHGVNAAKRQAEAVLLDNDVPAVWLEPIATTLAEGNATRTARLRIHRSGNTSKQLAVKPRFSGTAASGVDFSVSPTNWTIPAGAAGLDVVFSALQDSIREGTETIGVELTSAKNFSLTNQPGTPSTATLFLVDDETPSVTLEARQPVLVEPGSAAGQNGTLRIRRSGSTDAPLTVFLRAGGTATPVADYVHPPAAVTIPAGKAFVDRALVPKADSIADPGETILVEVLDSGYYNISQSPVAFRIE